MDIRDPLSHPYPPGLFCSFGEDDSPGGGGGGGPDPPAPEPPAPAPEPPPADDLDARMSDYDAKLAAYDETLAGLKAVTEAQAGKLKAAEAEVARLTGDVRARELAKAKVKPECVKYIPAGLDLSTDEGKTKLEAIREENPYFFEAPDAEPDEIKIPKARDDKEPSPFGSLDKGAYQDTIRDHRDKFKGVRI